jgi:hypothetical protein
MEYVPGCDLEAVWRELGGTHRRGEASALGGSSGAQAVLSASRKQRERTGPEIPDPRGRSCWGMVGRPCPNKAPQEATRKESGQ